MEWLKSLLASWKVRIALVGGALVVATTYGTCTLEPTATEANNTSTATEGNGGIEVSATTETSVTTTEATTETTNATEGE